MQQFIRENKMIYTSMIASLIRADDGEISKEYKPKIAGWKSLEHIECLNNEQPTDTHYLIKCNTDYIIFDTDNIDEYNKLTEILRELNLYKPSSITKSTRGDIYKYKRHFWFRVKDDKFKTMKKHYFDKLEVFIGSNCNIMERKDSVLKDIGMLEYRDYEIIKSKFVVEQKEVKKADKADKAAKAVKADRVFDSEKDKSLISILDGLKSHRWIEYNFWISIYWVFINENLNIDIFKHYSKLNYAGYDEEANNKILASSKVCNGYKIGTLYHYLKEDNLEIYKSLQNDRVDFWEIFGNLKSHSDPAILYYSLYPNKYILSPTLGWLEYNSNNILQIRGDKTPPSMLNHITKTFQDQLIEQRNLTLPSSKKDNDYFNKMKVFQNAYNKVGTASFVEGVIKYLHGLYLNEKIDELLDANKDLVAFDNALYDNKIKDFRDIKPTDYISKTCRYSINKKSNKQIREVLVRLIKSMFDNDEIYNYHLKTISLSLFGNKTETFIINSGKGRNGKGVCSTLIENSFGDYFYSGESSFLTTIYKADRPNSTLYNLRGVRYFLTTEPEADNETKFNIGLIKKITGNDTITTRDLNKSNISYKPQFTPFLQCNTKPKIDTIDDAIKNRFRIINFPFAFVNTPTKPNEKQGDNKIKDMLTPEMYNEFMLLLLEYNKIDDIKTPKEVLNEVDAYLNTNNFVKEWLDSRFILTTDKADSIRGKDLLNDYNQCGDYPVLTNIKFAELMKMNNIGVKTIKGYKYYYGLKLKEEKEDFDI